MIVSYTNNTPQNDYTIHICHLDKGSIEKYMNHMTTFLNNFCYLANTISTISIAENMSKFEIWQNPVKVKLL